MTHIKISRVTSTILLTGGIFLSGCSGSPVAEGVNNGRLGGCPSKDNCVSSFTTRNAQKIAPLTFSGSSSAAMEKLKAVLAQRGDAIIKEETTSYLRVEFTTSIMRFVDDGEFLFEDNEIQLRSAARLGYSDFGKNRDRLEEIRAAFEPCCN